MLDSNCDEIIIANASTLGETIEKYDCKNNFFLASHVPEMCKDKDCILGIDEAGRGPALGPMVYGAMYCVEEESSALTSAGCADSKTLSEASREDIFKKLCSMNKFSGWNVEVISPTTISNSMLRRQKVSLNEISHNAAIGLVKSAQAAGVRVSEIFVDTVGPADKYQAKLEVALPGVKVTVSKKADSLYPIVSAASICAKVSRDVALKLFKCPETPNSTLPFGSGYPNDPETKKFLNGILDPVFGFPQLVRFSWSTAEKIMEEKGHRVDWEDEDANENVQSVKKFFSSGEARAKHRFFKDRHLTNTVSF